MILWCDGPCVELFVNTLLELNHGTIVIICRSAAMIGRQLAVVGDDINNRYAPEFSQMICMLHLTPETAYEAFAGVARKYVEM